ncbi:MAG TPA: hypothetical protein VH115_09355 [Solirubrobacteraceae bacterium]|nr:hypothetical protein [Solirubrobacteraceae bacterium]
MHFVSHHRCMYEIAHNQTAERDGTSAGAPPAAGAIVPAGAVADIDNLVLRVAGSDDGGSIDELAERAGGARRPAGALMLAAVDGRVLAAASMSRREAVSEPTLSGLAARAVVEYALANLERRGSLPRRAA